MVANPWPARALETEPGLQANSSLGLIHWARSGQGQDLGAGVSDQQSVLELSAEFAILGDHRPAVLPHVPFVSAEVEHRLGVTWFVSLSLIPAWMVSL